MESSNKILICDFCGTLQNDAHTMVRGEHGTAICDECIDICGEIMAQRRRETKNRTVIETLIEKARALRNG